jgi:hypothetical protein
MPFGEGDGDGGTQAMPTHVKRCGIERSRDVDERIGETVEIIPESCRGRLFTLPEPRQVHREDAKARGEGSLDGGPFSVVREKVVDEQDGPAIADLGDTYARALADYVPCPWRCVVAPHVRHRVHGGRA